MHIKENEEVMIFKSSKGNYSIGLSRKDRNGNYFNGYFPCQFKNGIEVKNKTKIKLKNSFISFYLKDEKTIAYLMILDFEEVEDKENYFELKGEIEIDESKLPF